MSFKSTVVGVAVVAGLATGAMWYVEPHTTSEINDHQRQVQVEQGSDGVENEHDRQRQGLGDGIDMENREDLRPGEHRPPIKIRIRP